MCHISCNDSLIQCNIIVLYYACRVHVHIFAAHLPTVGHVFMFITINIELYTLVINENSTLM